MVRNILRFGSAAALVGLAFLSSQCSVIAKSDLGKGIGTRCASDGECQGGICNKGVCSSECTTDGDCPKPSLCITNRCTLGCKTDTNCLAGTICEADVCRAGCREDAQCNVEGGEICDKTAFTCKAGCRGTGISTCGNGKICKSDVCVAGCVDDKGCSNGLICLAEACKAGCRPKDLSNKGCGLGQYCEPAMPDTVGVCKASIQVGAIVPGKTDGSDVWSTSHKIGLDDAVKVTPFLYFKDKAYELVESLRKLSDIKAKIDDLAGRGANAIITTTSEGYEGAYQQAPKYTSTKFLLMGARDNKGLPNVSSYRTNTDAGWYVTGRVAGRVVAPTTAKCVGLVLPNSGRQTVRDANAFIMGVRAQSPDAKVVIRWLGNGSDTDMSPSYTFTSASGFYSTPAGVSLYREELLAAQLADLGCAVIAHHTDTQRTVAFIEKTLKGPFKSQFGTSLFSMATGLENACRVDPFNADSEYRLSCAGSLYWNWGPQYANIFQLLKAGTWEPRAFFLKWTAGPDAPFKFKEHKDTASVLGLSPTEIQTYRVEMQNNPEYVFDPGHHNGIKFVGQRDLDKNGLPDFKQEAFNFEEPLSEPDELDRMCWFVQGAYEFPACAAGVKGCTATLASLVPALVPYGPKMDATTAACTSRADKCTSTLGTSTLERNKYGDVIDFIKLSSVAGDPAALMDCPTN